MARSHKFDALRRALRLGRDCAEHGLSPASAAELRAEREAAAQRAFSRRLFLGGAAAGAGVLLGVVPGARAAGKYATNARIAILGGGLAGLACADTLRAQGVSATIYEAHATRVGGRVYSNRSFTGQVAENGGELIDNQHKLMLAYAQELGLAREDLVKAPGETAYHFFGQSWSEEDVVDQMRVLVARMRPDLQALSGAPSFFSHNPSDLLLDHTSLEEYLATRGPDLPLATAAMKEAYVAEYGREPSEQSCLNMLLFFHLDRRSSFDPFATSDERWHLIGGNDAIATGIADRLPGPIVHGARVTRIRKNAFGQYALTLSGSTVEELADALVIALPFSVLRNIVLDPNLGLSVDQLRAISELGYGHNAKTMIQFDSRPWATLYGSNGTVYSDLPNVQNVWETNYTLAGPSAILTDYSGGERGRQLQQPTVPVSGCGACHIGSPSAKVINPTVIQGQVDAFLTDLDVVYPGVKAAATRDAGAYRAHFAHWLTQSTSRGSYTCYLPGQFTSICGLESVPAGLVKFAGEHADSFYNYQGFMEGALTSGIRAAGELLDDIQAGRL
ncbi:MAG: FAD-dependent oxidoreductase [Polyangiaceae bacterium]|nr:FAD-dependent oxidoreductase [Polyangiaceae bacterium]